MQNELPEWAMEEAVTFEKDLPSKITGANRVFIRAVLARALVAAERRGIERAAEAAAKIGRPAGARDGDTYIPGTSADAVRAIRQLGEEP